MVLAFLALVIVIALIVKLVSVKNNVVAYEAKFEELSSAVNIAKNKYIEIQKKSIQLTRKVRGDESDEYQKFKLGDINSESLHALGQMYPELKSNFDDAANRLESLYNDFNNKQLLLNNHITTYNTFISTFPTSLFAGILGCEKWDVIGKSELAHALDFQRLDDIDDYSNI